jgi:hypothetical protein
MAELFLQVATQAPQPIQVAASIVVSAACLEIRIEFAPCVFPDELRLITYIKNNMKNSLIIPILF